MVATFQDINRRWIDLHLRESERIRDSGVVPRLRQRIEEEGGHLLRVLPMHFLFSAEDSARLAGACIRLIALQTKLLRHMVRTDGREYVLDLFRTPESMRRFVNWQELLEPEYLVARHDILETPHGYRFCECNVDSCVAGAEIFDFMVEYLAELGSPSA